MLGERNQKENGRLHGSRQSALSYNLTYSMLKLNSKKSHSKKHVLLTVSDAVSQKRAPHYTTHTTHISGQVQKFLQQVARHHSVADQVASDFAGDCIVDVVGQRAHSLLARARHHHFVQLQFFTW